MGPGQEKEYIQIPEELLANAGREQIDADGTAAAETDAVREFTLNFAEKTAQIFYDSLDESWKKQGLSGFSVKTTDLSKLTALTARQSIPDHWLEQSPGAALVTILAAEFGRNWYEGRRKKQQEQQEQENTENTAEND